MRIKFKKEYAKVYEKNLCAATICSDVIYTLSFKDFLCGKRLKLSNGELYILPKDSIIFIIVDKNRTNSCFSQYISINELKKWIHRGAIEIIENEDNF